MRYHAYCPTCLEGDERGLLNGYSLEVRDDGNYKFECAKGHKVLAIVHHAKYDYLFGLAIQAIVDGYYRDAVVTAASSLERLYEHFVQVNFEANGMSEDVAAGAWRNVSRQSERQLGMFIGTYTVRCGVTPPLLDTDAVGFRNKVAHQGFIPRRTEAVGFLNAVLIAGHPIVCAIRNAEILRTAETELNFRRQRAILQLKENKTYAHIVHANSSPFQIMPGVQPLSIEAALGGVDVMRRLSARIPKQEQ